jgi:hypothetical protein
MFPIVPYFCTICFARSCLLFTYDIWHKLNYFSFCPTFEKLFIICVEILIKSKFQLLGFANFNLITLLQQIEVLLGLVCDN